MHRYDPSVAKLRYPALRELDFGMLDAADEASVPDSSLLTEGYYDHKGLARRIAAGSAWLVIGPKGSGKSAAFEHLRLTWANSPVHLFSLWRLGGWPVGDVTKIKMGISDGDASAQGAWEFFLFLRLFDSLTRDQGAGMPGEVLRIRRDFEKLGLLGNADLRTRFVDWSSTTVRFSILGFGAEAGTDTTSATLYHLTSYIREACARISTASKHRLALDGLDQFFAESHADWRSLAGLVHAVQAVNQFFASCRLDTGVVLAIRSEIFSSLPSTDSAKLLDRSVRLDWTDSGIDSKNRLWEMVNQKALASMRAGFGATPFKDLRRAYFTETMQVGRYLEMPQYFLSHTRLLPRDLVALMRQLQDVHPGYGVVTSSQASETVRRYAENYFVAEIFNNLHGTLRDGDGNRVLAFKETLSSLPKRYFTAEAIGIELRGVFDQEELRPALRRLYEIGAIGVRRGSSGSTHTDFVFRRTEGGSFAFKSQFALHSSLVVAWNVPW